MIRVGLTGGYATGKSFVAAELDRLGCHLIYADKLGHQVLEPGKEAYQPVIQAFGRHILESSGRIDRKKLGAIVFGNAEQLKELTAIIHPAVFRLETQLLELLSDRYPAGIAVVEAAILVETGRYREFDCLIVTSCDEALQYSRGRSRDGLTDEQIRARLSEQMPLAEKRKYAHFVIDTGGSSEDTLTQAREVYAKLRELAEQGRT